MSDKYSNIEVAKMLINETREHKRKDDEKISQEKLDEIKKVNQSFRLNEAFKDFMIKYYPDELPKFKSDRKKKTTAKPKRKPVKCSCKKK